MSKCANSSGTTSRSQVFSLQILNILTSFLWSIKEQTMENWCWFVIYNNIGNFDVHCRSSFLENPTWEKEKNKLPTTFTSFSRSVLLSTIALDQSVCKKLLSYGKKHNVRWPHNIGMSEKLRPWKLRTQTPPENQTFRYPIIHRLIPSPYQFEIRQWQMLCFEVVTLRTLTTITGLEKSAVQWSIEAILSVHFRIFMSFL